MTIFYGMLRFPRVIVKIKDCGIKGKVNRDNP